VINLLNHTRQRPGLTEEDILLSLTTLSFDISVPELFLPLTIGARAVLVSRAIAVDGMRLIEKAASSHATVMQATPATWRLLLAAGWRGEKLKIFSTGEALSRELADQLLERAQVLWNLYGPTETTVWSAAYKVRRAKDPMPIGRPIDNTQLYLLDANLQPVPMGVPGELYIGGVGLAHGYLNRPGLTGAAFIPNPFSDEPGARLYKTGDLVRYLPDGDIEFLGRIDRQVKIRGFRIELGEIEAHLSQYPAVREAVVLAREGEPGDPLPLGTDKRLVGYVVAKAGQKPTVSGMHHFLREKLPDYMVPSAFVTLDALPLTPSGKIDRRALPAPDSTRPELEGAFVAPETPTEKEMARIWTQVLGLEQIGIHDNFFELGGHSLLATQVASRVRATFQIEIPLYYIFETPTVAGLAKSIETTHWAAQGLQTRPSDWQREREEGEL